MESRPTNPLAKHFRQPAIYFKLPSGGKFWPTGSLNLPPNGELPVYPMTVQDEITLKTPDALMNGQGQVTVIQSCCPNIVDAWNMPSIDVDATLMAIRIASYGSEMQIGTKCPKCGEEHEFGIDLNHMLNRSATPDYSSPVEIDSLKIYLQPQLYNSVNQTGLVNYEEERIVQTINNANLSDIEKVQHINQHLARLVDLNYKVIVDSTLSILTNDGIVVTDKDQISEYFKNASNQVTKAVQARLKEYAAKLAIPDQDVECHGCKHKFKLPIVFDYASFFAEGF